MMKTIILLMIAFSLSACVKWTPETLNPHKYEIYLEDGTTKVYMADYCSLSIVKGNWGQGQKDYAFVTCHDAQYTETLYIRATGLHLVQPEQ